MGEKDFRKGLVYALGAYGLWGLIPLYFKTISNVSPLEILAHRVVWSFLLLAVIVTACRRWTELSAVLRSRKVVLTLLATTGLIAVNWLTYIYAVSANQVLQSSLGYFITPLMNVLLGVLFLKERLRTNQVLSILLAIVGVLNLGIVGGRLPWIALLLSISFSFYGLLRKTVAADGLLGLFVETLLLFPLAVSYIVWIEQRGMAVFGSAGEQRPDC
jgi:chloramphenicol-sensitive protein RarD